MLGEFGQDAFVGVIQPVHRPALLICNKSLSMAL